MAVAVNTQRDGTKKRRSLRRDHFINNSLIAVIEIDDSVFFIFYGFDTDAAGIVAESNGRRKGEKR